jgi:glycolate oxidase FAD binding subunit
MRDAPDSFIADLCARIRAAHESQTPLSILGGGSKQFLGGAIVGEVLNVGDYRGIIDYEPRELVLTVRAGTPLAEIEKVMDAEAQMLAFEPPHYGCGTIGGTIAAAMSGPRRPYAGAARDFVLGARIVNGRGEDLQFGGRVIKNVAGYDVSRLMVGAMGTLGVLTALSFKVLPKPAAEATLQFEFDEATAIQRFNEWAGQPLPLSGAAWYQGVATLRLSGAVAGVAAARAKLGGQVMDDAAAYLYWRALREQQRDFFKTDAPLWRLSVPQTAAPLSLTNDFATDGFIDWGGGLRWVKSVGEVSTAAATALRNQVAAIGGHVTLYRAQKKSVPVFHPLTGKLATIHCQLKAAFDPANILNRGRMDNIV